ncbi:hypothetical protein GE253_22925 [Niveispirillum sp. SYP-B3756]|uniref:hypothetical protein n=1 Tax=Niveispirillum sp. SYP-B3756 TaxID=2662178 RepID=UPI001291EDFA|nr:hypothetical protein [Niveispirillum sp. SYP-B3756]MQP68176.1 hypothetical protein [Niveispirillum sp. SYP-B3756]
MMPIIWAIYGLLALGLGWPLFRSVAQDSTEAAVVLLGFSALCTFHLARRTQAWINQLGPRPGWRVVLAKLPGWVVWAGVFPFAFIIAGMVTALLGAVVLSWVEATAPQTKMLVVLISFLVTLLLAGAGAYHVTRQLKGRKDA